MVASGATAEDFAAVCVKSRHGASFNPWAQFRDEISVAEVLGARVIQRAPDALPHVLTNRRWAAAAAIPGQ